MDEMKEKWGRLWFTYQQFQERPEEVVVQTLIKSAIVRDDVMGWW